MPTPSQPNTRPSAQNLQIRFVWMKGIYFFKKIQGLKSVYSPLSLTKEPRIQRGPARLEQRPPSDRPGALGFLLPTAQTYHGIPVPITPTPRPTLATPPRAAGHGQLLKDNILQTVTEPFIKT